jgi:hypothetical protein
MVVDKVSSNKIILLVHIFVLLFLSSLILLVAINYWFFYLVLGLFLFWLGRSFSSILSVSETEIKVLKITGVKTIDISEVKKVKFHFGESFAGNRQHSVDFILKNNKKALNFSWGSRYGLADMLNVLPDKSVVDQKSFKKLGIELRDGQFKRV